MSDEYMKEKKRLSWYTSASAETSKNVEKQGNPESQTSQ